MFVLWSFFFGAAPNLDDAVLNKPPGVVPVALMIQMPAWYSPFAALEQRIERIFRGQVTKSNVGQICKKLEKILQSLQAVEPHRREHYTIHFPSLLGYFVAIARCDMKEFNKFYYNRNRFGSNSAFKTVLEEACVNIFFEDSSTDSADGDTPPHKAA